MSESYVIPPLRRADDPALTSRRANRSEDRLGFGRNSAFPFRPASSDETASSRGSTVRGGAPTAVFSVEDFRRGVVINAGGDRTSETDPPDPVLRSTESNLSSLPGRASDESTSSPGTGNLDLPPGAFGRRYRPLANGRLADATVKTSELSEEGKMSKLRRIKESAEEYEGFLMAEMIKTMRQTSFAKVPGGDTYSEIAEKPFTAAMTAAGGLGLAATIVGQVAAQEGLDDALAAHPEVMGRDWRRRLAPSMMPKAGFRPPIVDPPAVDSTIPTDGDDSPRTTSISTAAPTENFTAGDVDR